MKLMNTALWIVPILLVGCGRQPSVEDAEAMLCGAINDFGGAVAAYSQLDAQSTVDDLREVRSGVAESYAAVQSAATALQDARIAELETAYSDLDATVSGISGRDTLGEAASQVGTGLVDVQTAREQLYRDLNCQ